EPRLPPDNLDLSVRAVIVRRSPGCLAAPTTASVPAQSLRSSLSVLETSLTPAPPVHSHQVAEQSGRPAGARRRQRSALSNTGRDGADRRESRSAAKPAAPPTGGSASNQRRRALPTPVC